MDELFEVLTLLDTGKTTPAPVVLLDTPDGSFWKQWMTFIDEAVVSNDYVDTKNMCLVRLATSVPETIDEIELFYSNYVSFSTEGERGLLSLRHPPAPEQLADLKSAVPMFAEGLGFLLDDEKTLSFSFDGRNFVNLRLVIDEVNNWSS
jgi:hypothetical protein